MTEEHNRNFQALVSVLARLSQELLNLSIENDVYREFIALTGLATPEFLEKIQKEGIADPLRQAQAQEEYSEMLEALRQAGIAAGFEEMLDNLPPTERPN